MQEFGITASAFIVLKREQNIVLWCFKGVNRPRIAYNLGTISEWLEFC